MRRREFVILFGWAAAWPFAAQAQQIGTVRRISILHSGFPLRTRVRLLIEALRTLGYDDGKTATIELLGGEGDAVRLKTLAATLAAQKPEVIIALTSPAVRALKDAGVETPVVFAFVSDPVALGIVKSLAHPGANITGITYSQAALGGKRLDLLLEALPGTRNVAVIWSHSLSENATIVETTRQAAKARGVELFLRDLEGATDLAPAFDEAKNSGATALVFVTDNLLFGRRKEIAELALARHLPSMHSFSDEVEDGGLMSYGPELKESYGRAAVLADRILKGALPADLPVEEPTRFELAINLKTAKVLGLTLPASLLATADEVIE
jgi:putative tryptophan/tyrosine transport system substrate-binding protein